MKKRLGLLLMTMLLAVSMVACGSSAEMMTSSANKAENSGGYYDYDYDGSYDMVMEEAEMEMGTGGTASNGSIGGEEILTGEKLVYTCNLTLQTLQYDSCVQEIKNNIQAFKGIIESESESDDAYRWYYSDYVKKSGTRYLHMTIRIPSENYYEFLDTLDGKGKIISKDSYVENISRQYYETSAMIKSLEIQQDRLLEMMEKATSIEDMITIEARLSEVQYQLSLYKNQLASMDADVEYSTITIRVEEVMEYTEDEPVVKTNTFGDRLKNTLVETWEFFLAMLEGILFLAIRLLPVALVLGVFVAFIVAVVKLSIKRSERKQQKKAAMAQQDGKK